MKMLKSVLFGLTMTVVFAGCGLRLSIEPIVVVSDDVVWYPTYQQCCYFYGNSGWIWDYHSWHHHHHRGHHHEGYDRRHTPPRYTRPYYTQPQYAPHRREEIRRKVPGKVPAREKKNFRR